MQKFLPLFMLIFIAACGTTTKKFKELPPLASDAPVKMFWSKPNLKYEEVCQISVDSNNSFVPGHTTKEDFQNDFEKEARKCGADGVIFLLLSGYAKGNVTAVATGIKILSEEATPMSDDKIRSFSLAVQSHQLSEVKTLLGNIPKEPEKRAPTDEELLDVGLYLTALDGLSCDPQIADLLLNEYHAHIRKYGMLNLKGAEKPDSNIPYCKNLMATSIPMMTTREIGDAILKSHNYYIKLINDRQNAHDFNRRVSAFHDLLLVSGEQIQKACVRSEVDPTCELKKSFLDESSRLEKSKIPAIRRNAQDLLKALSE